MELQSLETIVPNLEKLLENPRRSFSGVFKAIRRELRISAIGDYPLAAFILDFAANRNYRWTKEQVAHGAKFTDFKGKHLGGFRKYYRVRG